MFVPFFYSLEGEGEGAAGVEAEVFDSDDVDEEPDGVPEERV